MRPLAVHYGPRPGKAPGYPNSVIDSQRRSHEDLLVMPTFTSSASLARPGRYAPDADAALAANEVASRAAARGPTVWLEGTRDQ